MMTRNDVLDDALQMVASLRSGWDDEEITEEMLLLGDLNWQSIQLVVLANTTQQRYGQTFPFEELFAEVSDRGRQDLTVGEWVDFIHEHLGKGEPLPEEELAMSWDLDALD
ncbi:hypothetical protein BH24GEM3_BH24GEM3_06990 [soil metagenome]